MANTKKARTQVLADPEGRLAKDEEFQELLKGKGYELVSIDEANGPKQVMSLRVDESLKEAFAKTTESMGLTMNAAIEIFMREVVHAQGIPFAVRAHDGYQYAFVKLTDEQEE